MSALNDQILETWNIHHRISSLFYDAIPEEAMNVTLSKRGGRDIARQLAHIQNVRVSRIQSFAKKAGTPVTEFDPKVSPPKAEVVEALKQSGEVMSKCIEHAVENDGKVSNFKRGVVPMIGYYISHECHHRGNILLTMKQHGHKIPDELKWKIWEWNKI